MTTALNFLVVVTAVAAVQGGFVPPAATSYIYRSDNHGPASFIQLGAPALATYDLAPVPLPYIAKPIVEDAEENNDDSKESSEGHDDGYHLTEPAHGDSFAKGSGNDYGEEHHSAHGDKGGKGYKTENHHDKGESGKYGKEHHEGYYDEAEGGKKGHHDETSANGKYYESGENYKGGDHGHKEHFSKGEDVTGYHKVFHKDEFKKDHDFYDVADNSGHFNKHGSEAGHHGSEESGHKKGGHHDSAFDKAGFGKAGFYAKGLVDDSDHGHSAKEGHDNHYYDEAEYGKKGGSSHEKGYGYNDNDGDEDDDHE